MAAKNSDDGAAVLGNKSTDLLRAFIERIERLEEEKKAMSDDIKEVYAEAKGNGFDTTALRSIVRLRKLEANERAEARALLDTYMHALGMLSDLPLGLAAAAKVIAAGEAKRQRKAQGGDA